MEQKEDGFNIEGDYLYFAGYFKLSNIRIHHTNVVHFTVLLRMKSLMPLLQHLMKFF